MCVLKTEEKGKKTLDTPADARKGRPSPPAGVWAAERGQEIHPQVRVCREKCLKLGLMFTKFGRASNSASVNIPMIWKAYQTAKSGGPRRAVRIRLGASKPNQKL